MRTMLFTPRIKRDGQWERLRLRVSVDDYCKLGNLGRKKTSKTVVMTDVSTGHQYKAKPASCGLDCYCDAIVVEVSQ